MAKSYFFGYTEKQLINYIKSVGKAQNQRLRELEKRNLDKSSVAYKYLMKEKKRDNVNLSLTQKGKIKFDLKTKGLRKNELLERAKFIKDFSETKTSTVSGIKALQNFSFEQFKIQYKKLTGNDYAGTFADYSEMFTDKITQDYMSIYGSIEVENLIKSYGENIAMEIMQKAVDNSKNGGMPLFEQYEYGNELFNEYSDEDYF